MLYTKVQSRNRLHVAVEGLRRMNGPLYISGSEQTVSPYITHYGLIFTMCTLCLLNEEEEEYLTRVASYVLQHMNMCFFFGRVLAAGHAEKGEELSCCNFFFSALAPRRGNEWAGYGAERRFLYYSF